jgi:hypothetical protein
MADNSLKLFGFEIKRANSSEKAQQKIKSVVPKADDDGEAELDYIKAATNLLKRGFNPDALIAAIQAASRQAA